jgi:hypothetical protein
MLTYADYVVVPTKFVVQAMLHEADCPRELEVCVCVCVCVYVYCALINIYTCVPKIHEA